MTQQLPSAATETQRFISLEALAGAALIVAAIIALVLSNSPLAQFYQQLLNIPVAVQVGTAALQKPLLLWINDGLMAVFFLLVGLELKRELLIGELASRQQLILPAMAAVGGFIVPALVFVGINWGDHSALNGWAIPTATDIAFALGILALLGSRVPLSLKIFLTAIAIIDDLLAIVVIALFYSGDLAWHHLLWAAVITTIMVVCNRMKISHMGVYLLLGLMLWVLVLKSGVHATLAGVVVAFCIPLHDREQRRRPLEELEHRLHPYVAFLIVPIFAFANAGVSLSGIGLQQLLSPLSLGLILGLFLGKQLGVMLMVWISLKFKLATLPKDCNWSMVYGVALLTGIGFTMSLFIGSLAFEHGGFNYDAQVRIGVLFASLLSAVLGYCWLRYSFRKTNT